MTEMPQNTVPIGVKLHTVKRARNGQNFRNAHACNCKLCAARVSPQSDITRANTHGALQLLPRKRGGLRKRKPAAVSRRRLRKNIFALHPRRANLQPNLRRTRHIQPPAVFDLQ